MSLASTKTIEDIDCSFPKTLAEALKLLADEKTRGTLLSGGTDLFVQWEAGVRPVPDRAINIKSIPELREIKETPDAVVIGAAVTHSEIRHSAVVKKHLPSLAEAAATVGGSQIQALGTLAGSVANASPAGDLAPSLLITNGSVTVASVAGERTIPLDKFFIGYKKIDLQPNELIVRFTLPKLPAGWHESFRKLGPRAAQAISKVMASYRGHAENGTIKSFAVVLGSVAPTAIRLPAVESWLVGKKVDANVLAELEKRVSDAINPISDIRSTAEYRKWVSGRIVRGFVEELTS